MSFQKSTITASELIELGYDIYLPDAADHVSYYLHKDSQPEIAQATFTFNGENYTYEVIKSPTPMISTNDIPNNLILSWNAKGLDLHLLENNTGTSVNWYSTENKTQHILSSSSKSNELIHTAREVLLLTGLDLANAPSGAKNIQYQVFPYEDLILAETTFTYENTHCSYRMAATLEIDENYADISGTNDNFEITIPGDVAYCLAKLSYTPSDQGKIIWFDVVPGILYSLTMEDNASEDTLLSLANELFEPAQGDSE
jgi:hypothetical protein